MPEQRGERTAAFFDVDRTLFPGSSMLALARPSRKAGLVNARAVGTAVLQQLFFARRGLADAKVEDYANLSAAFVRGLDAKKLEEIATEYVPKLIEPKIYPAARQLMKLHRDAGDMIILVSSAPREIVAPLAKLLGADDFACTDATVKDGFYTGEITRLMHAREKGAAVERFQQKYNLDLKKCAAYGDAAGDVHMLELVGRPACVNPDRELLAVARAQRWRVLSFSPARRLRRDKGLGTFNPARLLLVLRGLSERTLH